MKIDPKPVLEQAIGTIIATGFIALIRCVFNAVTDRASTSSWLLVGVVTLVVCILVAFVWQTFRKILGMLGRWTINNWQLVLLLLLLLSAGPLLWSLNSQVRKLKGTITERDREMAAAHATQTVQAEGIAAAHATQTVQAEGMAAAYATQTVQAEEMAAVYATQTAQANKIATLESITYTLTPTPTLPPTPNAVVSSDSLNLRAGCGTGYHAWANYPQGTALDVLGKAAGAEWLRVKTPDGRTGWMHAQYLQVNVPLVDVPIAACTFQDFERDNGTPPGGGNYFWDAWFTTCSFESTIVHEGGRSVCVDAHARTEGSPTDTGGTMGINPSSSDPVDLSSATTIYVWVYDTQGSNTVELKLRDIEESVSNPVWSTMQSVQNNWTQIEWAVSGFTGVNIRRIKNLEIYEWNDGIYYFDDVGWR
jgi:hypothetical protein